MPRYKGKKHGVRLIIKTSGKKSVGENLVSGLSATGSDG